MPSSNHYKDTNRFTNKEKDREINNEFLNTPINTNENENNSQFNLVSRSNSSIVNRSIPISSSRSTPSSSSNIQNSNSRNFNINNNTDEIQRLLVDILNSNNNNSSNSNSNSNNNNNNSQRNTNNTNNNNNFNDVSQYNNQNKNINSSNDNNTNNRDNMSEEDKEFLNLAKEVIQKHRDVDPTIKSILERLQYFSSPHGGVPISQEMLSSLSNSFQNTNSVQLQQSSSDPQSGYIQQQQQQQQQHQHSGTNQIDFTSNSLQNNNNNNGNNVLEFQHFGSTTNFPELHLDIFNPMVRFPSTSLSNNSINDDTSIGYNNNVSTSNNNNDNSSNNGAGGSGSGGNYNTDISNIMESLVKKMSELDPADQYSLNQTILNILQLNSTNENQSNNLNNSTNNNNNNSSQELIDKLLQIISGNATSATNNNNNSVNNNSGNFKNGRKRTYDSTISTTSAITPRSESLMSEAHTPIVSYGSPMAIDSPIVSDNILAFSNNTNNNQTPNNLSLIHISEHTRLDVI